MANSDQNIRQVSEKVSLKSAFLSTLPPLRLTKYTSLTVWAEQHDQLAEFQEMYKGYYANVWRSVIDEKIRSQN